MGDFVNEADKNAAIARYAERLERLGPVPQALGWRDRAQQELRFDVIAAGLPGLAQASLLDVGCGFGDLHGHVKSRRYVGCDISPEVLAVARKQFADVSFEERDILAQPYAPGSFDYVCMSGLFNHRQTDNQGFLERMLAAAFAISARGVAANMMTNQVDYRDSYLYYYDPEQVLRFCRSLSRRVALRHDYPLYEFTVFVYRTE